MAHIHRLVILSALAGAAALGFAACDGSASSQQAKSDAVSGVNKTADGLGNIVDAAGTEVKVAAEKAKPVIEDAAARAKPAAEKAAADAKTGLHKLAVAGAKVVDKTGDVVEKAGDHAQAHADKVEGKSAPPAQ